jgi:hypothetical protein
VESKVKGFCAGAESAFFVDGGAKGFLVGAEVNSLIRTKGSPIGILEGSAKGLLVRVKGGSLVEAEGFPGGSLVGAEVSSLVRAAFAGAGSGGLSLAPDGTVGISFGTPLMFTSRTSNNRNGGIPIGTPLWFTLRDPLWLTCSLSIDSMWLILRLAIFLWATRAVGSLVEADVSFLIWLSVIRAGDFLVGPGGSSSEEGIDQCCAGSFLSEVAGSSGIRGGSLGKAFGSSIRGGSLGKAIGSSLGEGTGSSLGKAMGSFL